MIEVGEGERREEEGSEEVGRVKWKEGRLEE